MVDCHVVVHELPSAELLGTQCVVSGSLMVDVGLPIQVHGAI